MFAPGLLQFVPVGAKDGRSVNKRSPLLSRPVMILNGRPEVAIPLAELNMEFFPRSVNTLVTKAIAQAGRDDEGAVATLKQALELDPGNGEIQGRLYQIEEILARRKRFAPK